jgi:hypothetical protein
VIIYIPLVNLLGGELLSLISCSFLEFPVPPFQSGIKFFQYLSQTEYGPFQQRLGFSHLTQRYWRPKPPSSQLEQCVAQHVMPLDQPQRPPVWSKQLLVQNLGPLLFF